MFDFLKLFCLDNIVIVLFEFEVLGKIVGFNICSKLVNVVCFCVSYIYKVF